MVLPGLPDPHDVRPAWMVQLHAAAGGPVKKRGRGALWVSRLFVGALLHLGVKQRNGHAHCLRSPAWEHQRNAFEARYGYDLPSVES